jgi:hypothetical protein
MIIEGHDGYVVVTEYNENFPSKGICGGNITPLGKLQADKSIWHTVKVEPDSVNPEILNWLQEGDWCAENEDLLHWSIVTKVDQANQKVSGRTIFKGGTGQFKNAEGYMDLSGHPDPKDPASRFVVEMGVGEIFNVENSK